MKIFAERLRKLRQTKEMTQIYLDKLLGYTGKVSQLEMDRREPSVYDVIALGEIFNVSTDYLLGVTDVMKRGEKNE